MELWKSPNKKKQEWNYGPLPDVYSIPACSNFFFPSKKI